MNVGTQPRVINVVQARLASTRFPRKALVPLLGIPMIEWVARRCERATMVEKTVFALPEEATSDELADVLLENGHLVHRGGMSEEDVLGRVQAAAVEYCADVVVRTCADRPLVDPGIIDSTIRFFLRGAQDGIAFSHQPTESSPWDYGFGVEVLHASVLDGLSRAAREARHREHVTLLAYETGIVPSLSAPIPRSLAPLMRGGRRFDVDLPIDLVRLEHLLAGFDSWVSVGTFLAQDAVLRGQPLSVHEN